MTTSPHKRVLAELSAPDVLMKLDESSIVLCPVGAVEQHGPHLPLATDLIVVEEFVVAAVEAFGDELDLWRLPAMPFSKSNEHAWSPGTVWLGPETVLAMMRDLGRSLAMLPSKKIVFVNGHGGNSGLLDVVCRELRLEFGLQTFLVHATLPADHGGTGDPTEQGQGIHGGVGETSLMLHLRPDLVDMSQARPAVPTWLLEHPELQFGGTTTFGWLSNDFASDGVIGDPTPATAAMGKVYFEEGMEHLGAALRDIASFRFPGAPSDSARSSGTMWC